MNSLPAQIRQHPWYATIVAVITLIAGVSGVQLVGDDSTTTSSQPSATSATSAASTGSAGSTRSTSSAAASATATSGVAACQANELPDEAYEVIADITAGGPFDYPAEDGSHFGNYEGILPKENSQYYREYTVDTPGLSHRGMRRIVTGGNDEDNPETWYYTDDHYESFCSIQDAPQLAQAY